MNEDNITRLKSIADLRDSGIITENEFQIQKSRIMAEPDYTNFTQQSYGANQQYTGQGDAPVDDNKEQIHGTVPNAKGKFFSRDLLRNQMNTGIVASAAAAIKKGAMFDFSGPKVDIDYEVDREYDLIFTSKRLIRAKLSDPGLFGLLSESVSLFSRVAGVHKDYKNEREKYQTMSPHQILSADEYNIEILYSDIESVWFGKIGKMVGFNFLTTTHFHQYNFPSIHLESTKQLINTFFPDKYVDEEGQVPEF